MLILVSLYINMTITLQSYSKETNCLDTVADIEAYRFFYYLRIQYAL